jgi:polyprenyl-phospho-N-acetylgalactosaminyl synthase
MKNIFVIIPAYNEEKKISQVIKSVKEKLPEVSICVVDDNSTDNTFNKALSQNIFALKHIVNRGQGAALQTGNDFALSKGAEVIVHFDGDGQHRVEDIERLIRPIIEKDFQVVLGSRFLGDISNIPFTKKFFILKPALIVNYFFTGVKLTDAHNGLRALSREAAKKINITQDRMAHNTEIIAEIKRNKLKYKEVSVEIIYNEYGQGFFDGLKILRDLIIKKIF